MNKQVQEFFDYSAENPWGDLMLVHCTPEDLRKYTEGNIADTLERVLNHDDWKFENSRNWADKGSGNDVFYLFKVYELWKSIRRNGVKSPVHVHAVAEDNWLNFHPSTNKIEVLCEFFPEMEIKVLYHSYDFLMRNYPDDAVGWHLDHMHYPIETAVDYLDLYAEMNPEEVELEFFWAKCSDILTGNPDLSGKLKPRARDWRYVNVNKYNGDPEFENAVFLTVNDRYHRIAMKKDDIFLKDIIQTKPGKAKFCGKWFDIS